MKNPCFIKVNNRIGMQTLGFQGTALTLIDNKFYYNFHDAGEVKKGSYHIYMDLETGDLLERLGLGKSKYKLRLLYDAIFVHNDYDRTGNPYSRYKLYRELHPEMGDDDIIYLLMGDEHHHIRSDEIEFFDVYSVEFREHLLNNVIGKEHYETQVARLAEKLKRETKS